MLGSGSEIGAGTNPMSPISRTVFCDKYRLKGVNWKTIICEAHTLPFADENLDYLVSAHMLEHVPNPLKVLREWIRCLKPKGKLIIALPHGNRTFDKGREITSYEHILNDFDTNADYGDKTHLGEFMNISAKGRKHIWEKYLSGNIETDWKFLTLNGHIHYHVWDQSQFSNVCFREGIKLLEVHEYLPGRPDSFLIVGEKY